MRRRIRRSKTVVVSACVAALLLVGLRATEGAESKVNGLIPGQGDQWPTWRGPLYNGQAIDCAEPLVDDMCKARIAWVSEKELPGPTPSCHHDCNSMGSPIVAEDRVYNFSDEVDKEFAEHLETDLSKNRAFP